MFLQNHSLLVLVVLHDIGLQFLLGRLHLAWMDQPQHLSADLFGVVYADDQHLVLYLLHELLCLLEGERHVLGLERGSLVIIGRGAV